MSNTHTNTDTHTDKERIYEEILPRFSDLSSGQIDQLIRYTHCIKSWNRSINLISRKDDVHFVQRHLLHSLLLKRVARFPSGAQVMDVGTGGGLPGIPLAICFPECRFKLVDSIGKKVYAVKDMTQKLGLKNTQVIQSRVEALKDPVDFVLGRAVRTLPEFIRWTFPLIRTGKLGELPRGIWYLKGTDAFDELRAHKNIEAHPLSNWSQDPYFEHKYAVFIPR